MFIEKLQNRLLAYPKPMCWFRFIPFYLSDLSLVVCAVRMFSYILNMLVLKSKLVFIYVKQSCLELEAKP